MVNLKQLEAEIKKHEKHHVFWFKDNSNNEELKMEKPLFGSKKSFTYQFIIEKYGSIPMMLQSFSDKNNVKELIVHFRKKNGSSSIKTNIPAINILLESKPKTTNPMNTNQTQATPHYQNQNNNNQQGMGVPGLGFAEYMDLRDSKTQLKYETESKSKLQKEYDELKLQNAAMVIKLREAESKCQLADDRLKFETERASADSKGVMGSEAAQNILKQLPMIVAAFKGGAVAPQPLAGVQETQTRDLSAYHEKLLEYIEELELRDDDASFYYMLLNLSETNLEIKTTLKTIIEQQQ